MKKLSVVTLTILTLTAIGGFANEGSIKIKCNVRTKIAETGYDAPIMKELASDTKELLGTETRLSFSGVAEDKSVSFTVDVSLAPYNKVIINISDKSLNREQMINMNGVDFLNPKLQIIGTLGGDRMTELKSQVQTRELVLNCNRVAN